MNDNATKITAEPYLFFGGRCQEALDFYTSAVGAKVEMVVRFNESPDPVPEGMLAPGFENKVMHCLFRIGGNAVMASDGCSEDDGGFKGFSLALQLPTVAEVEAAFNRLAEGGSVRMPLGKTFWSESYGQLTDRFGLEWMVMVYADPSQSAAA